MATPGLASCHRAICREWDAPGLFACPAAKPGSQQKSARSASPCRMTRSSRRPSSGATPACAHACSRIRPTSLQPSIPGRRGASRSLRQRPASKAWIRCSRAVRPPDALVLRGRINKIKSVVRHEPTQFPTALSKATPAARNRRTTLASWGVVCIANTSRNTFVSFPRCSGSSRPRARRRGGRG